MILHPVVVRRTEGLRGRAGVELGRRLGRRALERSAELAGAPWAGTRFPEEGLPADKSGAPLPRDGWHWSTTNTRGLIGALVAPCPVALDAEWVRRPRLDEIRSAFDPDELARVGASPGPAELAVWTAKEAVLKLTGVGLAGLPGCRVVEREGPGLLRVTLDRRAFRVRQQVWGEHLLAFACDAEEYEVRLETLETP